MLCSIRWAACEPFNKHNNHHATKRQQKSERGVTSSSLYHATSTKCFTSVVLYLQEHLDYEIIQSLNPEFNKAVVRVNIFKEHRQTIQVENRTGPLLGFLSLNPSDPPVPLINSTSTQVMQ